MKTQILTFASGREIHEHYAYLRDKFGPYHVSGQVVDPDIRKICFCIFDYSFN